MVPCGMFCWPAFAARHSLRLWLSIVLLLEYHPKQISEYELQCQTLEGKKKRRLFVFAIFLKEVGEMREEIDSEVFTRQQASSETGEEICGAHQLRKHRILGGAKRQLPCAPVASHCGHEQAKNGMAFL